MRSSEPWRPMSARASSGHGDILDGSWLRDAPQRCARIARQVSPFVRLCLASACWCSDSLGLRPNLAPRLRASTLPALARFRMRCRSSSASADRNAMNPRPIRGGQIHVRFFEPPPDR